MDNQKGVADGNQEGGEETTGKYWGFEGQGHTGRKKRLFQEEALAGWNSEPEGRKWTCHQCKEAVDGVNQRPAIEVGFEHGMHL